MLSRHGLLFCLLMTVLAFAMTSAPSEAADAIHPVTLATATEPEPADEEEPLAAEFSIARAAQYLDTAALHWTKTHKCATCHTNVPYLMTRPLLSKQYPDSGEVRDAFERWSDNWETNIPENARIPTMAVALGSTLLINDHLTTGEMQPVTRRAWDRIWETQRPDGGWDWRTADAPPMKSDEHYGVTFAAVALGMAPPAYVNTEQAQAGLSKMRQYLAEHRPPTLHHRAMVAWASLRIEGLMSAVDRDKVLDALLQLQQSDGGWSSYSLFADWEHWSDLEPPEGALHSDGYGTGFVIYLARQMQVPVGDAQLQRGIKWLKSNQRESGRWFTRSIGPETPYDGNRISTAATAFAIMALDACHEIDAAPVTNYSPF